MSPPGPARAGIAPPKRAPGPSTSRWTQHEPTPAGNQLRHAARLIAAYAYLTGDCTLTPVVLLVRLAALAEAVADLRESQQRAAQAAAALRAARHLRTATRPARPARPPGRPPTATAPSAPKSARPRPGTAAGLAQLSIPAAAPPTRSRSHQCSPGLVLAIRPR